MTEEVKTFIEKSCNTKIETLSLDDTFDFQCQQCGHCCMFREDISLNPFDIYIASKELNMACTEFMEKFTHPILGHKSKIPMVMLNSDEKTGYCPFLMCGEDSKFKCAIHASKPSVCTNHPLGIVRDPQKGIEFIKVEQCENSQGHNSPQLVKEWAKRYIDYENELRESSNLQCIVNKYFPMNLCTEVFGTLFEISKELDEKQNNNEQSESTKSILSMFNFFISSYLEIIYGNYDTSKDFLEQMHANKVIIDKLCTEMQSALKGICADMPEEMKDTFKKQFESDTLFDFLNREGAINE